MASFKLSSLLRLYSIMRSGCCLYVSGSFSLSLLSSASTTCISVSTSASSSELRASSSSLLSKPCSSASSLLVSSSFCFRLARSMLFLSVASSLASRASSRCSSTPHASRVALASCSLASPIRAWHCAMRTSTPMSATSAWLLALTAARKCCRATWGLGGRAMSSVSPIRMLSSRLKATTLSWYCPCTGRLSMALLQCSAAWGMHCSSAYDLASLKCALGSSMGKRLSSR
mmetsp:Transcript_15131/g.32819  ORF Transcript_15131/g.32819 Transcript_15131/m.32819 type:complete len:230 (-) Transcript_15131:714-1403(-)